MNILNLEAARAQAGQALIALEATWPVQEIEEFIAECNMSLDRECPKCGQVQPDDDSSDCWCCGAVLDPDDVDPTLCKCGKPGFSFFNGRWYCYPCIEKLAEGEAEKNATKDLFRE
jgi:hypothetical protein